MTDLELLQTYARTRSEEAFEELVSRHLSLVYTACYRQLRDRHWAEDATQGVFIVLSQKAARLNPSSLQGWLLVTAHYACSSLRRTHTRQQRRERMVAMSDPPPELSAPSHPSSPDREDEALALLDTGLCQLAERDRAALVAHYFNDQPLRQVGQLLGVSEEAARKRVDRALDQLRDFFTRRSVHTSSIALVTLLTREGTGTPLPEGIGQAIARGVLQAGYAGPTATSISKGISMKMLTAKLQFAAVSAAAVAITLGAGWMLAQTMAAATPTPPTPPPPSGAVAAAPAPLTMAAATTTAPDINLTTPENALASIVRAMKEGDRAKVIACLAIDPQRPPTLLDLGLENSLAENRFLAAARNAFGEGADAMQNGFPVTAVGDFLLDSGAKAQIEGGGARAALFINIPPDLLRSLPQPFAELVRPWDGQPLRFRKEGAQWKIDFDRTARLAVIANSMPLTDEEAMKLIGPEMRDEVSGFDALTQQITTKQLGTLNEVRAARATLNEQLAQKYNFTSLQINPVPLTTPATTPATRP